MSRKQFLLIDLANSKWQRKENKSILLVAEKKTSTAKCDSISEAQLLVPLIPFLYRSKEVIINSFFSWTKRKIWYIC